MSGFIGGEDRSQARLFPERIDDYVAEDSPVRVVDVFIEDLDVSSRRLDREAQRNVELMWLTGRLAPDKQLSLTDPDSRSMNSRGSGMVGYNVQSAVDSQHHLIIAHEVTNVGSDRSRLANLAKQAKATLQAEDLAEQSQGPVRSFCVHVHR